ncbi:MAG: patatin-like phospholipase family protein [Candidatus Marinimicrobia bacterium]|nr:patatin-like phospholipase family protein [Candidatus Neomarinimicrobiota bacterium]
MSVKQSVSIGLALGSGSARGWAHIGVIEALEENNIPIDCIAGTSIGAFVGAVYAAGDINSLKEFALRMDWKMVLSYFDVVFPKSGFLDGKKVHDLFSMHTNAQTFADFRIPVRMLATDLNNGQQVILDSGNIIESIRASVSVPGVFTPVRRGDQMLVDGGLVNPVPVDMARAMGAAVVIAVDLNTGLVRRKADSEPCRIKSTTSESAFDELQNSKNEMIAKLARSYVGAEKMIRDKIGSWFDRDDPKPNILEVMGSSLGIMEEQIARINLALNPPDVLIQPRLGDLKMFDFDQAERSIAEGYQRTIEQMDAIQELIDRE